MYSLDSPQMYTAKAGPKGIVYIYTMIFNGVHTVVFTDVWNKIKKDLQGLLERDSMTKSEMTVNIKKIGIDLIDEECEETAYINIQDVFYKNQGHKHKQKYRLFIGPSQIDSNGSDCSVAVPFVSSGINFCLDMISNEGNKYKHIPTITAKNKK
jgi:hypothetical protein